MRKDAVADLARSAIDPSAAQQAGIASVDRASTLHTAFAPVPALVIPYHSPWTGEQETYDDDSGKHPFFRIRYLRAVSEKKAGFVKPRQIRYMQPPGSGVHIYFPRLETVDWKDAATDTGYPIIITEGEKKAIAGTLHLDIATIGLGGVHNFTSGGNELHRDLARIEWKHRPVYLCFDSDAASNPHIQLAEGRLAAELGQKRGAAMHLVRLSDAADGSKRGIDDYVAAGRTEELARMIENARRLGKLDTAVLALNEHIAWIEQDAMVYDLSAQQFIRATALKEGSRYSALTVPMPSAKGTTVKNVSVAATWLKHPHAQRYERIVFDPGTNEATVPLPAGGQGLNLWHGFDYISATDDDIRPFLDLDRHLFSELHDHRDLPLKWAVYRAQNPARKIPISLVFLGPQGSGKSMWAEIVTRAFGEYGAVARVKDIGARFTEWMERALVVFMDEAKARDIHRYKTEIYNLITSSRLKMEAKYRGSRYIANHTSVIITSNERAVASLPNDDRRMFVVGTPAPREKAFYDRVGAWIADDGPRKLMGWMLNHDLRGWEPPQRAPETAEKYMAYFEGLTPVQRLAEDMRNADHGVIMQWIDSALAWASEMEIQHGGSPDLMRLVRETRSLVHLQVRPWYTPDELTRLFPLVAQQLHNDRFDTMTTSGRISKELREAGITYLRCAGDPRGFRWRGSVHQFLVIADVDEWREPLTQEAFEQHMSSFRKYKDIVRERA